MQRASANSVAAGVRSLGVGNGATSGGRGVGAPSAAVETYYSHLKCNVTFQITTQTKRRTTSAIFSKFIYHTGRRTMLRLIWAIISTWAEKGHSDKGLMTKRHFPSEKTRKQCKVFIIQLHDNGFPEPYTTLLTASPSSKTTKK